MRTDDAVPARRGFGTAAAISGDQVLVAEVNDVRAPGAVYVYGKQGGLGPAAPADRGESRGRGPLRGLDRDFRKTA